MKLVTCRDSSFQHQINGSANDRQIIMCKLKNWMLGSVSPVVAVLLACIQAKAELIPPTCNSTGGNASDATPIANTPGPLGVGQTIEYKVVLSNPSLDQLGQPNCRITNAFVNLRLPDGTIIPVLTNITLNPGDPNIICPQNPLCLSSN